MSDKFFSKIYMTCDELEKWIYIVMFLSLSLYYFQAILKPVTPTVRWTFIEIYPGPQKATSAPHLIISAPVYKAFSEQKWNELSATIQQQSLWTSFLQIFKER